MNGSSDCKLSLFLWLIWHELWDFIALHNVEQTPPIRGLVEMKQKTQSFGLHQLHDSVFQVDFIYPQKSQGTQFLVASLNAWPDTHLLWGGSVIISITGSKWEFKIIATSHVFFFFRNHSNKGGEKQRKSNWLLYSL